MGWHGCTHLEVEAYVLNLIVILRMKVKARAAETDQERRWEYFCGWLLLKVLEISFQK
jgi:hypothetical protein